MFLAVFHLSHIFRITTFLAYFDQTHQMNQTNQLITHLGAEHNVTGSCHLLQVNGLNIMVDCGIAQGKDYVTPMEAWPVLPSRVNYLFLTHAHIDHIGRVPELVQRGFKGEIIATHATKALLEPMLQDAMSFSDMTEDQASKILETIDDLSWGFEYNQYFDLKSGIRFKLGRAGHILGSCFILFEIPMEETLGDMTRFSFIKSGSCPQTVGYQASGTPGRDIIKYSQRPGGYVNLDGKRIFIRAEVHALTGYSAHADQNDLIKWVQSMPEKPGKIKLVHGKPEAQEALKNKLHQLGYVV